MPLTHSYDARVFALLKSLLEAIRNLVLNCRANTNYSPAETISYLVPDLSLWWTGAKSQPYVSVSEKRSVSHHALVEHVKSLLPGMPEYVNLLSALRRNHSPFAARLEGGV